MWMRSRNISRGLYPTLNGRKRTVRILAAIDPSHAYSKPIKLDREILRCASMITRALRGALHATHAFDPLPIDAMASEVARMVRSEPYSAFCLYVLISAFIQPCGERDVRARERL